MLFSYFDRCWFIYVYFRIIFYSLKNNIGNEVRFCICGILSILGILILILAFLDILGILGTL